MQKLTNATRKEVYTAPTIPWNNDTYTPVSNQFIMDRIVDKIKNLGLNVKNDSYIASKTKEGLIKGVIGSYDIATPDNTFGQRIMFRNSYDKSMSFAFVCGAVVWICSNGCVSGDYTYKRIHRGVITDDSSTTIDDIVVNLDDGFNSLQQAFETLLDQMNVLQHFEIAPKDVYDILGELFFKRETISISQMNIIKKELQFSKNFRHLGDADFTAYDLYNHITESLKISHPLNYIKDHVTTHKLFEEVFDV